MLSLAVPPLLAGAGCVSIDGGAVEVAWSIFAPDGRAINDCGCTDPAVASLRLNLVSDPDGASQPCAGLAACRFACDRKIGATPFIIPPGQYLISLVAVDQEGADIPATSVLTPPPQSRSIVRGQPTELEAFMIETGCKTVCNSGATQPCSAR
ncbi:MAG: hypothetical protein ABUL77_01405 [Bacteroidota bacterium]